MLRHLLSLPEGAGDGAPVLILLHGRGSDMHDLQGLARALPPEAALLTPRAPHPGGPWGYGPGWAWYRYLGEDRPEAESLEESLSALEAFLEKLPRQLGFEPGPRVLMGHQVSPGEMQDLKAWLRHEVPGWPRVPR